MKKLFLPLVVLTLAFAMIPAIAWARGIPKAKITSTAGASASSTVGCGQFTMQCDAAVCENTGLTTATADCTLGTANSGKQIQAGQLFPEDLPCSGGDQADTIAIAAVSGNANCEAWRESYGN